LTSAQTATDYAHFRLSMMRMRFLWFGLAALVVASLTARGTDKKEKVHWDASKLPPPASKPDVTYAADIKPIFDHSCVKCHGEHKPKGHLRLDSLVGVLKGGEDGKVVVPGKSDQSVIMANIAHLGDPDDYMPPPKNKAGIRPLTTAQISLMRAWIEQGAR
jgi:Planctomycete cytochrome C